MKATRIARRKFFTIAGQAAFGIATISQITTEAPGVGTPVRGGATLREAHLAMEIVHDSGALVAMDLVEINPILDRQNQTAELCAELIASAFGRRIL